MRSREARAIYTTIARKSIGGATFALRHVIYIDSKSLYEYLVKLGTTYEKRLIVNLMYLR